MEDHGYIQDAERFGGRWYSDVEEKDDERNEDEDVEVENHIRNVRRRSLAIQ